MTWHVWTDGSYRGYQRVSENGSSSEPRRGAGGWAAIVEHRSEGFVLRGAELEPTSAMRMELTAIREGLRATPALADVVLHTDALAAVSVAKGGRSGFGNNDLVREIADEYEARVVRVELIVKQRGADGERDKIHVRAHAIAAAEALAKLGNPARQVLRDLERAQRDEFDRAILGSRFRREVRAWRERENRVNAKSLPR